jgi:hypothetical protein
MADRYVLELMDDDHKRMWLGSGGMTDRIKSAHKYKSMEQASDIGEMFTEDTGILVYPKLLK